MPRIRLALAASLLALAACDAGGKNADHSSPGPQLSIATPRMDQVVDGPVWAEKDPAKPEKPENKDKVKVEVMLDLRDYEIGKVEDGKNGQHVHLILDDEPYVAVYDVSKAWTLWVKPGTHVLRAFPSAGPKDAKGALEHESRKNAGAFAWVRFHARPAKSEDDVRSTDPALLGFDATKNPTLTYSRPKGDYKPGSATLSKFLLDFYVTGTTLSKGGIHVRATIDGKPATAEPIVEWKPTVIESPAPGEHEMTLELLDRDDRPVEGPFNKTVRKFRVLEK
jgi:hypothetical protein